MNKKWEYINANENEVNKVAKKHNISPIIARVLINRGILGDAEIEGFIHPKIENLNDPFLLNDMEIAVDRIIKAKENDEKITIYGDYDVDGITSIATLSKFLTELGVRNNFYLPNRLDEGYGLNNNALQKIVSEGTSLLITVDCGISALEEIEYAKSLGLDVIVTDHHECPEILPLALAVIDPKRSDSTYPFSSLAGVGVTFKLIHAISLKLELDRKKYLKYLDIVCLGTVADIVPLIDENRIIVNFGLILLRETRNVGLKALIGITGYKEIDSTSISFGLAPRINACGRMGEAELALKLLLTDDKALAEEIANQLNEINKERQEVEKKIFKEATEEIEQNKLYKNDIIVVGSTDWHHGVIGIVASKITDLYYKPTVLISFEDGEGKGSGRSIEGFDLHEALTLCNKNLEKYGGHEMAIGLSLKEENFNDFKKDIEEIASRKIDKDAIPSIKIDGVLSIRNINKDLISDIKLLEPYGENNQAPLFVAKNLKVESVRLLSSDKHLKLSLKEDNISLNAIGFNLGDKNVQLGEKVDIVFAAEMNRFNNVETVQLNLKDIKKSLS